MAYSAAWNGLNAVFCEYTFEFQTMSWADCVGRIFYCLLFIGIIMNAITFLFVLIFDMLHSFWTEYSEEPDANFLYKSLRGKEVSNFLKNTGVFFYHKFAPLWILAPCKYLFS